MITLRVLQLLPEVDGSSRYEAFTAAEDSYVTCDGVTAIDVCLALGVGAEQLDRVIYQGRAYFEADMRTVILFKTDQDPELHVIPAIEGKNAAVILGVVGAAVGFYFGGLGGAQAGWALGMGAVQGALTGYAVGATIGGMLTPRPQLSPPGGDGPSTHQWQGVNVNEDTAGVTLPVAMGEGRTGGIRISAFIRRKTNFVEEMGVLLLVSRKQVFSLGEVRLNDQPASNFPGMVVETRLGTPGQAVIPGFNAIANTFAQNVDLTELNAPYTYTTNRFDCDAFEVLLTMVGLSHTDDQGNLKTNTVRYSVEFRIHDSGSGWTFVQDAGGNNHFTVTSSVRVPIFATTRKQELPAAKYDIRVTWIDMPETQKDVSRDQWHIFLTGVTEEKQDTRNYEKFAIVGVYGVATEQLDGRLPDVTVRYQGILVPVWSGSAFLPATWVGDEALAPAGRNPAWLTLEVIRNQAWGAGNEFADYDINLPTFLEWAEFCSESEMVTLSDGSTYEEPRCQLDLVLNLQMNMRDLLITLCAAGRAMPVFSDGRINIVIDRPVAPTQTFNVGNMETNSFVIQYQSRIGQLNAYDVTINDRDRDFEPNSRLVISKQQVEVLGQPLRPQQISRPGVTRITQAVRDTTIDLQAAHYIRRVLSYNAAAEAILVQAGDVVRVAHDVPQWGYSGRVSFNSDLSHVFIDQPVYVNVDEGYELTVHHLDDTVEIIPVHGADQPEGSNTYNRLTLAQPLSQAPAYGALWAFGPVNISTKPFRVLRISMSDFSYRRIEAVESVPEIYDTSGIVHEVTYTQLPNPGGFPGPITSVVVTEEISERKDDSFVSTLIVQWTKPSAGKMWGAYLDAQVDRSYNYDPLDPSTATWEGWTTGITEARWPNAPHGLLLAFRVTPRSQRGYNVTGAAIGYKLTSGYNTAPAALQNFRGTVRDNTFVWEWDEPGQQFLVELRNANSGWGDDDPAKLVHRGRDLKFTIDTPTARSITLYGKVIDRDHNYSVGAVAVTITDAVPLAPTITAIERYKNTLKVRAVPNGATTDYLQMHLHASQVPGFVPSPANRVAQTLGRDGGEFLFQTPTSGNWFFKATDEDWLSNVFNDWTYSAEVGASIIIITPVPPTNVAIVDATFDNPELARGIRADPDGSGGTTYSPIKVHFKKVTWDFTDSVSNPAGAHIGFAIIAYTTDPAVPIFASGILTDPAARAHAIPPQVMRNAQTVFVAVQSVYESNLTSPFASSTGALLDPLPDPPLASSAYVERRMSSIDLPETAYDYLTLARSVVGVRGLIRADTSFTQQYKHDGYGVALESGFTRRDLAELSAWVLTNCTVVKITTVRQPIAGAWDVYAVTVVNGAVLAKLEHTFAVPSEAGLGVNFSVYAMTQHSPDADLSVAVSDTVAFSPAATAATLTPYVWRRLQIAAIDSWPNANLSRRLTINMPAGEFATGEVLYLSVPQYITSYFAHEADTAAAVTAGRLRLDPGPVAGDNWTMMFRFRRRQQSTPRFESTQLGYFFEARGATGNAIRMWQDFSTGRAHIEATNGAGTTYAANALLPVTGFEENTLAVVRAGNSLTVYLNGGLLIPTLATPTSPTLPGPLSILYFGNSNAGTSGNVADMSFKNLAIFSVALPQQTILDYLNQGIRFATSNPAVVIPRPVSVTMAEI